MFFLFDYHINIYIYIYIYIYIELVGTYIQSKLTNIMNKEDIGLYRDDGLGIFRNISRLEIVRKKKAFVAKVFKKCRLSIVVDTNLKTFDFLIFIISSQNENFNFIYNFIIN